MTHDEILLIAGQASRDDELVAAAAAHRPRRVTVLIDAADGGWDASDRLAGLLTAIERATGAIAVGLVGAAARLDAAAFDAVVQPPPLLHAA